MVLDALRGIGGEAEFICQLFCQTRPSLLSGAPHGLFGSLFSHASTEPGYDLS